MSASLLASANGASAYHGDWRSLLDVVPACDLLCVDAPYSERTHKGHDSGVDGHLGKGKDSATRRVIDYRPWTPADVAAFVEAWSPRTRGWFVTLTDHALAPAWSAALEAAGRYVFAPIGYTVTGSRVRLSGDGPSCWMVWIVVARPCSPEFATWGALPGGYVLPPGYREDKPVPGGKETWIAERLCEHYSRPGDLCVDPCAGAGTLAIGAIRTGRRAIVGDADRKHAEIAARWIVNPHMPAPRDGVREVADEAGVVRQPSLFAS